MTKKYTFGTPFNTGAIVRSTEASYDIPDFLKLSEDKCVITTVMGKDAVIYGLGESIRGINKRGYIYTSKCTDEPHHTEEKTSLYGAHNFIVVDDDIKYGIFVDYPSKVTFDVGYTDTDLLSISIDSPNYDLYIINGNSVKAIIKQFRELIGESYIAPFWAFGFQQSRWGYKCEDDIRNVLNGYRNNHIPLDAIYLDIDYMERFKDFTINEETFPNFADFVSEMKRNDIHLVPIIDAGVKIEDGYSVYEEGHKKGYFCKDENGCDFVVGVWPGRVYLPDFLNEEASHWFGHQYKILLDMGIDGFWNDMNEPALFYSEKRLKKMFEKLPEYTNRELSLSELWDLKGLVNGLSNNDEDYASFYHNVNGKSVRHDTVHNLYGYNMTKSASEAFKELCPDKNILMFSRSSYIGMHRYGGIWTGDNSAWWSHIELLMHQLPNLNMCGFIYTGGDTGGFGANTTEDLMMRFTELSLFTPLMRNHAALGTRDQELYRFKDIESFRNLVGLRYSLIPYLYSEYIKAIKNNDLYFTPLGIAYPEDSEARHIEDQLMVGGSIMITPVYKPNQTGRYVYLPEDMTMVRFRSSEDYDIEQLKKGHHHVNVAINEVLIFIRNGCVLPVAPFAETTKDIDYSSIILLGATPAEYDMFINECEIKRLSSFS